MARPIKETPVIKGKDAITFTKKMHEAQTTKLSPNKVAEIKASYEKVKAMAKF
jgi:hypothetical protein